LAGRRAPAEQQASCTSLAQPKPEPARPESPVCPASPLRTWAEQRARCEELSRPLPEPTAPTTPEGLLHFREHRTASEQKRHCAQLAQPRQRDPLLDDEELTSLGGRHGHLAARAAAPASEDVVAARTLLAEMRERAGCCSQGRQDSKGSSSRPPSAAPSRRGAQVVLQEADMAVLSELRGLVEEVLWVALLQVRSCPRAPPGQGGRAEGAAGSTDAALEDRLCSLLISAIGPNLRPVARRVLGPGQGLVRRLRCEFPRLHVHLGFRESEDAEPPAVAWTAQELTQRTEEVRGCRDRLLAMDITKTMISRLGQL